jgi:hypothetical protein
MVEFKLLKFKYAYASLLDMNLKLFLKRVRRKLFFLRVNFASSYLAKVIKPYSDITINLSDKFFRSLVKINKDSNFDEWTVVVQGPVNSEIELDYLKESLFLLKSAYSGVKIVICTYLDSEEFISEVNPSLYDKKILLNKNDYKNNFERQVASTSAGLRQAREWGSPFSIKLRTDQRLLNPASLQLFRLLLDEFKDARTDTQTRVIFGSYNSWLYRPFGLSDMFTAGHTDELSKYWNFDQDISNFHIEYQNKPIWLENKVLFFESFLNMRYLNNYCFPFTEDKFKDTSDALRDYFIVVDSSSIGQEWLKRNSIWSGNSIVKAGFDLPNEALLEINFVTWLLIKNDILMIRPNELAARH